LISPEPYQALQAEKCPTIESYFDRRQTNMSEQPRQVSIAMYDGASPAAPSQRECCP
jgi:hypothetical protein